MDELFVFPDMNSLLGLILPHLEGLGGQQD